MQFLGLTIFGFGGMEIFSYLVHRFLFHGVFWRVHQTHHKPNKFFLELNDVFSLIFAVTSMSLMIFAEKPLLASLTFPIGLGIAIYGLVYFLIHDFFTHRRFLPFGSQNKILLTIRAAHQRHHQSIEKPALEPYGLFIFDYKRFFAANKKGRDPKIPSSKVV
ncbi:MAG: sterol desaturase family protein [Pyrinomonadaceae bacterium]|nr:sterol desaturase family protein [Pyrinomonadaceae bacterium]